jgi:ribonuclease-3
MNQKDQKKKTKELLSDLNRLQKKLRHQFHDIQILIQSLTHSGAASNRLQSNERLEFLGDRVLGLTLAKMLLEKFPNETEGKIAYRFSALARSESLARIAKNIDLAPNILLDRGAEETGGRENPGILADCCEAIIAAIYLDGGYEAAEKFINENWLPLIYENIAPPKDAKTLLQEWTQGLGLELPVYKVIDEKGPAHAPFFTIEVTVHNKKPAIGEGTSKQTAEQNAANSLMAQIRDIT